MQFSWTHPITVPLIERDRNVRFSRGRPHESQQDSEWTVWLLLLSVISSFAPTGAGPGLISMSPANSNSSRTRYSRLLSNLRWRLGGVGRGSSNICLTGTRMLHHGENWTVSSDRSGAVRNTAVRSVYRNTLPNIFSRPSR